MTHAKPYKRIIWTSAADDLMSHDGAFGVRIRRSRNSADPAGTFVIEAPHREKRRADRLVALFDELIPALA